MGIKINKINTKASYTYKELKNCSIEEVQNNCTEIIFDKDDIIDEELLHRVLINSEISRIICQNYEQALIIKKIKDRDKSIGELDAILEDDYEMKDRAYIDISSFEKSGIKLWIPISYAMWNVNSENKINIIINLSKNGYYYFVINKDELKEIHRICQMIANFPEKLTDIEKIIIVCNYIERYCQFIEGAQSHLDKEIYQLDDKIVLEQIKNDALHNPVTALIRNFGVCKTFARTITLLLNNQYIKINAHILSGQSHEWNSVELNGTSYQLDVTRCITRSENRDENNLKTLKFDMTYILFGTDFGDEVEHEKNSNNYPKELSKESINQDYLHAAFEHLEATGLIKFDYSDEKTPYQQHKI